LEIAFEFHLLTQQNSKSDLFLSMVISKNATGLSSTRTAVLGY